MKRECKFIEPIRMGLLGLAVIIMGGMYIDAYKKSALVQKVESAQSFSKPRDMNSDGLTDYIVTNDDGKSTFTLIHYKNKDGSDYFVPETQRAEDGSVREGRKITPKEKFGVTYDNKGNPITIYDKFNDIMYGDITITSHSLERNEGR